MKNLLKRYLPLFLSLIILVNFHPVNAANFNDDLREIRAEINRDNLQEAIKKIKKIKISNENEQEKIDLLFGDIYLKINQIDKAEEFYQKTFFTTNEEIEARTFIGLAEVRLAQGKLIDALESIIAEYDIRGIIIGNPINMDGTYGKSSQSAKDIAIYISNKIDMPVSLWDERLSTVGAFNLSSELDINVSKREKDIDKFAAAFILQGALDFIQN